MIQNYSHTIASGLTSIGIDYNKVARLLNYDTNGKPLTNIALNDKESKESNPYIFVNQFEAAGNRHFSIVAKNHKGGAFIFDSFKESKGDTDYSNYTPIIHTPKPKQPPKEKPWFKRALSAWNDATNTNVLTHDYIVKKGVSVEGIELKRGGFAFEYDGFNYADCVMMAYRNIDGVLCGFQFIDATGNKRYLNEFEGGKSGAFAVIGNADLIERGAIFVEGLVTGLSAYHSAGDGKKTLNNAKKMPVVVCLDADNLKPVIDAFAVKYGADIINVYADNDTKPTGNKGRFEAVQICRDLGLKSYLLPVQHDDKENGLNIKADFNDTLEFKKIKVSSNKLEHALELLKFCPVSSIKTTYAERLAYALADLIPSKYSVKRALMVIDYQLSRRGIDADLLTEIKNDCESKIKYSVKNAVNHCGRVIARLIEPHNATT
jgi:phage/plasmid primase-like uncharacterized protein